MIRGDEKKFDGGKLMWDLLPLGQVKKIVAVLTYGAKKYKPHQWKEVEDGENRYYAAMMRHIEAWQSGEKTDPESGLSHLAHAACCLIFTMFFEDKK